MTAQRRSPLTDNDENKSSISLADLLPSRPDSRGPRHRKAAVPQVTTPASMQKLHAQAQVGSIELTMKGRRWAIGLDDSDLNRKIKAQLRLLAETPIFLWDHLEILCKDERALDDEAEQLVAECIESWSEIGRNHHWAGQLGKTWSSANARDHSTKVAVNARRLLNALHGHRDLAGIPSTEYWRSRDFEVTGIDAANPLLTNAPPLWMLLKQLSRDAECLAGSYRAENKLKPNRDGADQTLFLHKICSYLSQRFPSGSMYGLAKIANELTASAFPPTLTDVRATAPNCVVKDDRFYEAAKVYLRHVVGHRKKST